MHGLNTDIPTDKTFDPLNIFGASNGANTPAVEDSIAMIFNMPQRV